MNYCICLSVERVALSMQANCLPMYIIRIKKDAGARAVEWAQYEMFLVSVPLCCL